MCLFTQCHGICQVAGVDRAGSRRPLLAFAMLATLPFPLEGGDTLETVSDSENFQPVPERRAFWNPKHRQLYVDVMDNAFFGEEKEIPFLLCNQEIEDVYLQITNGLRYNFSWKLAQRMFSYCRCWCFCHFTLTFFCSLEQINQKVNSSVDLLELFFFFPFPLLKKK